MQDPVDEEVAWSSSDEEEVNLKNVDKNDDVKSNMDHEEKDKKNEESISEAETNDLENKGKKEQKEVREDLDFVGKVNLEDIKADNSAAKKLADESIAVPMAEKLPTSNTSIVRPAQSESSSGGFEIVEQKDDDWGGWD